MANLIIRYAKLITLIGTFLAVIGGYYSVLLYKNLRTDIHELLPSTSRSVLDLKEVTQRLESIDNLAILVFSKNTVASKRFIIDLAHQLEKAPKDTIASIEYKLDREIQFFKERQALFMDLEDLKKVRQYIQDRIHFEKSLYNPLNIFKQEELTEPTLNFNALKRKYSSKASFYENLPGGYFATQDQTKRVLLVNLSGKHSGAEAAPRLKKYVANTIKALNPSSYSPDLTIRYTGGVEISLEEQEALVEDLEISTVIVTIIVSLGMLLFYKDIRATLALILSLFIGTFWTFGLAYFLVGYLNANSAFLGSIVIGNGINFGIIFLARYQEERRKSASPQAANQIAITQTATSTLTAALAAGLSYGSLMLTGFRGFNQFGVIGLIGMILCWISAYTLLPSLLTLFDTNRGKTSRASHGHGAKPMDGPPNSGNKTSGGTLAGIVANTINRHPKLLWGLSIVITLLALGTLTRLNSDILETDLSKLRNKISMTQGAAHDSKYLDEIFQHYLSPMAILPHSLENTRKIAEVLKQKKSAEGKNSLIASVQTLDDFIPTHQEEKIQILNSIKQILPRRIINRLSASDRKLIQDFLHPNALRPITQKDLPPLILGKFTERDGSIGKMVLLEPPLNSSYWGGEKLIEFIADLRQAADTVEPNTAVAGGLAVTADMIGAISYDGPRATAFAFIAVVLLIIVLFRNVKTISLVLFSLFLGVIWLAGIILGFRLKINFLNFIALPITFGIGVDYGVNIFQRYRYQQDGPNVSKDGNNEKGDILSVIQNTGSAVGLCSFSTIVGYTSLLIASNQGFVSFGILAVTGELTCIIAAVISLPAYLVLKSRKDRNSSLSAEAPLLDAE